MLEDRKIDGLLLTPIFENPCIECGEFSDFNFTLVGIDQRAPEVIDRKVAQEQLRDALNRDDLRHPTKETRDRIRGRMEGRKLKLLFEVRRSQ